MRLNPRASLVIFVTTSIAMWLALTLGMSAYGASHPDRAAALPLGAGACALLAVLVGAANAAFLANAKAKLTISPLDDSFRARATAFFEARGLRARRTGEGLELVAPGPLGRRVRVEIFGPEVSVSGSASDVRAFVHAFVSRARP